MSIAIAHATTAEDAAHTTPLPLPLQPLLLLLLLLPLPLPLPPPLPPPPPPPPPLLLLLLLLLLLNHLLLLVLLLLLLPLLPLLLLLLPPVWVTKTTFGVGWHSFPRGFVPTVGPANLEWQAARPVRPEAKPSGKPQTETPGGGSGGRVVKELRGCVPTGCWRWWRIGFRFVVPTVLLKAFVSLIDA